MCLAFYVWVFHEAKYLLFNVGEFQFDSEHVNTNMHTAVFVLA